MTKTLAAKLAGLGSMRPPLATAAPVVKNAVTVPQRTATATRARIDGKMKQPESKIKTEMVKTIKAAGGYARRIEDQFAVGTLDLIMVLPGTPVFFAEVKIVKAGRFGPSDRQLLEMRRVDKATKHTGNRTAYPVLIGYDPETDLFHISPPMSEVFVHSSGLISDGDLVFALREYYNANR